MKTLKSPNKSKNLIDPSQKPRTGGIVAFVFVMTITLQSCDV